MTDSAKLQEFRGFLLFGNFYHQKPENSLSSVARACSRTETANVSILALSFGLILGGLLSSSILDLRIEISARIRVCVVVESARSPVTASFLCCRSQQGLFV